MTRTYTRPHTRRNRFRRGPRYPHRVIRVLPGWRLYRGRRRVGEVRVSAQGLLALDRYGRQLGIYPTPLAAVRAIGKTDRP
jgi:hypothetical protein